MNLEHTVMQWSAILVGSTLAYCLVLRRFADLAQPYRLRIAELGEGILASRPSLTRAQQTEFYLDNAFSGWIMPFAVAVVPFAAALGVAKYLWGGFSLSQHANKEDDTMSLLFLASAFASNPLFGAVFFVECAVLVLVVIVFAGPRAMMAAIAEFIRVEVALLGRDGKRSPAAVEYGSPS